MTNYLLQIRIRKFAEIRLTICRNSSDVLRIPQRKVHGTSSVGFSFPRSSSPNIVLGSGLGTGQQHVAGLQDRPQDRSVAPHAVAMALAGDARRLPVIYNDEPLFGTSAWRWSDQEIAMLNHPHLPGIGRWQTRWLVVKLVALRNAQSRGIAVDRNGLRLVNKVAHAWHIVSTM